MDGRRRARSRDRGAFGNRRFGTVPVLRSGELGDVDQGAGRLLRSTDMSGSTAPRRRTSATSIRVQGRESRATVREYRNEPGQVRHPRSRTTRRSREACRGRRVCPRSPSPITRLEGAVAGALELAPVLTGRQLAAVWDRDADSRATSALCLADKRFEVTVDWSTADGRRGSGGSVPGTNNSGLFYFFECGELGDADQGAGRLRR